MPRGGPIDRTKLWCLTYTGFVQHLLTNKSLSNDLYRHFGSYCEGSHPVPKVHFFNIVQRGGGGSKIYDANFV